MQTDWIISEQQNILLQKIMDAYDKRIEELLRTKVSPPIEGEITTGKIRWRGLIIHKLENGSSVLLQRGKQIGVISEPIKITNLIL